MTSTKLRTYGWILISLVAVSACKTRLNRSQVTETDAAVSAAAASTPSAVPAATPTAAPAKVASPLKPVGPAFAVEAGAGLGPIRFGSTVATVERHMQMKCEELTDNVCRYISAGIELELKEGAVSGIVIHRFNRPVAGAPDKTWGVFAGGIPPKVLMMMVPEAVIEQLGKPKRTEEIKDENPNWTVRRDTYDGLVLEYDKNRANGRLMLGQIRVVKR